MSFKPKEYYTSIANLYKQDAINLLRNTPNLSEFDLAWTNFDWSSNRTCSRGGWYANKNGAGVNIAMSKAVPRIPDKEIYRVYEYKSFDHDPTIGGIYIREPEFKVGLIMLHEVAHAAQYWLKYMKNKNPGTPHGDLWKRLYACLRSNILNPQLENQKELRLNYEKNVKKLTQAA